MKPSVVEPIDVAKGDELDVIDVAPWATTADQFVLEQPDRGLSHGVVDRIAKAADRWGRSDLGKAFGVANADILGAGVGVADKAGEFIVTSR